MSPYTFVVDDDEDEQVSVNPFYSVSQIFVCLYAVKVWLYAQHVKASDDAVLWSGQESACRVRDDLPAIAWLLQWPSSRFRSRGPKQTRAPFLNGELSRPGSNSTGSDGPRCH